MRNYLFLLLIFSGVTTYGQTIVTEAPSMTSSTYTLGVADFQIESRLEYSKNGKTNTYYLPSNLFRVGLGKRFEFRTQNGIIFQNSDNYDWSSITFRPISVGTKYGILNGPDRKTSIAAILDLNIPPYKSDTRSANFVLAVSHTIGKNHAISYNLGYNPSAIEWDYFRHNFNGTLMYSTMLSNKIGVYGEAYWNFYQTISQGEYSIYTNFDAGFIYLIRDHIQLDYSFGFGANSPVMYHALGFNILFNKN